MELTKEEKHFILCCLVKVDSVWKLSRSDKKLKDSVFKKLEEVENS